MRAHRFLIDIICRIVPQVLRNFNLTPFYIGIFFGMRDGANSLASPIWGWLCDRFGINQYDINSSCYLFATGCWMIWLRNKTSVKPYLVASSILVAISFLLMGASNVVRIFSFGPCLKIWLRLASTSSWPSPSLWLRSVSTGPALEASRCFPVRRHLKPSAPRLLELWTRCTKQLLLATPTILQLM